MLLDWLTPEWNKKLTIIAKSVVSKVDLNLRDDTYQEIWLKFLRYPPRTSSYAWDIATSVRDSLWRKEKSWQRLRDKGPEECNLQFIAIQRKASAAAALKKVKRSTEERLQHKRDNEHRWYHANIEQARENSRKRVRKFRRQQKKKQI